MKTSELTGALLDYWVGRAEGWRVVNDFGGPCWANAETKTEYVAAWKPSSNWVQGGAIIERERIGLDGGNTGSCPDWHARTVLRPVKGSHMAPCYRMIDRSPLVAAMRAYVASKFGDEVPDDHEAAQPASE